MHVTVLGKASNTREAGAVILYGCQNSPENSNFYLPYVLNLSSYAYGHPTAIITHLEGYLEGYQRTAPPRPEGELIPIATGLRRVGDLVKETL